MEWIGNTDRWEKKMGQFDKMNSKIWRNRRKMDWMEKYRWMRKKIDRVELDFFFKPDDSKNMEKWNEWRNTDKWKKMDKIELEVFFT